MKAIPLEVVAALVHARGRGGWLALAGPHGRAAWKAVELGLMDRTEGANGARAELNMRGQDVADDAIALAAPLRGRRT